ncbi:hypothetical protein Q8F55_007407 [Vanrija albida]|uniref:DUF3224 domain-containing protein n=1 Tax=Vanrija albida TaxID=181172 RepID=A0ABR3PTQ2_9TREE
MPTATATYTSHGFTTTPVSLTQGTPALAAGQMEQTFAGDLVGDGTSHFTLYAPLSAATDRSLPQPGETTLFEGIQVFEGTLLGRRGTFAASSRGVITAGAVDTQLAIYPGSGTGELAGISGRGRSAVRAGQTEGIEFVLEVVFTQAA